MKDSVRQIVLDAETKKPVRMTLQSHELQKALKAKVSFNMGKISYFY